MNIYSVFSCSSLEGSSSSSCSGVSHHGSRPSPGSLIPPISLYGATLCTAHSEPGGPLGRHSSKASLVTRNRIDSPGRINWNLVVLIIVFYFDIDRNIGIPESINKSCVSPSSFGYSQTHAWSVSSKRDGCCKAFTGISMSSKNPRVTENYRILFRD